MLSRDSWVRHTEHLEPGRFVRVEHDCGEGRVLRVEATDDGFKAWCFRCGEGDGFRVEVPLAVKLARLAAMRAGDGDVTRAAVGGALPMPQVRDVSDWPAGAALWLYRAGFSRAEIGRLGIVYHPPSDRVVLPVPGPDGPVFWQARAWQAGRMPKYIGPTPRPRDLIARWGAASVPTLTEDILSAMKIGRVSEGIAVLGTHCSDALLAHLMARGNVVRVWLDPDPAGRRAAHALVRQLRGFGMTVRDIVSAKDPKAHTLDEIESTLKEN